MTSIDTQKLALQLEGHPVAAQSKFEAMIATLPAEVLAHIFEYAVNGDATLRISGRWETAVALSHVCRCFREAALSCPRLWTNMSRSRDMVTTCLARSRNFPLDVELAVEFRDRPSYMSTFEEVAIDIVPHSKRWRRLDVSFAYNIYLTFSHHLAFHGGSRIIEEIRLLKAPMLESLYIRSNGTTDSLYKGYQDFARWDTPALRCVTAVHFFPIYLPALKNVTHLDLTLILNQINYDDLFRELSRMVSLVDLRLKLDRCRPFNIGVQQSALKLPSVKRLILEFEADSPSDSLAGLLKTVLFRSLSFPGAHELHVKMYVVDFAKERSLDTNDERAHVSLNKEMAHIFSNISQFPLVERFVLGVFGVAPAHEDEGTRNLKKGLSGELSIPLDFLPSVKHFTLQSNVELLIAAVEDIERVYDLGLPVLRKPSDMLPALETITIDMPEAALAATWVSDILRRQKERPGGWEEFRKLVVVTDDGGDSERKVEKNETVVYERDDALKWCTLAELKSA